MHIVSTNILRLKVGLETWKRRKIVTSQTPHTRYKWPPYANEWKPPHENFLRTPLFGGTSAHPNYFCSSQTLQHISINSMIILTASLNSILLLLVSISLGQTLSVSSQRHTEYLHYKHYKQLRPWEVCSLDDPWSFAASHSLMHFINRCTWKSSQ